MFRRDLRRLSRHNPESRLCRCFRRWGYGSVDLTCLTAMAWIWEIPPRSPRTVNDRYAYFFNRLSKTSFCNKRLTDLLTLASNIPNTYSAGLSMQALGRPFAFIPRFFWTLIAFVAYTIAGVAGREHFSAILSCVPLSGINRSSSPSNKFCFTKSATSSQYYHIGPHSLSSLLSKNTSYFEDGVGY